MPLRGPARRQPFPCDLLVSGITGVTGTYGFMLGKPDKGAPMISRKPPPLTPNAPGEYSYTAQPDIIEGSHTWADLSLGMGLKYQRAVDDRRYYYATNLDASHSKQIMPGPKFDENEQLAASAVDTTNGIVKFFEIGSGLWAANGRYNQKRASDNATTGWTSERDFGAGKACTDVIVHKQNGGTTTFAYFAMGTGTEPIWKFDGTTYTQSIEALYAQAFCITGQDLWRAHSGNKLSKVDTAADPFVLANWSAANSFYVGDSTSNIVSLIVSGSGILLVMKTDGVYILDENGLDIKLWPGLKFTPNSYNGKFPFLVDDDVWVGYGGKQYRITPELQIQEVGPERLEENDSAIHGWVTGGVGGPFGEAWCGIYNPDSGAGYLAKAVPSHENTEVPGWAWHAALGLFGPNQSGTTLITTMYRSTAGASSNHERVYAGGKNGVISYFQLPCVPNPVGCSSYTYNTTQLVAPFLILPIFHGGFPADQKHLRTFVVSGENLDANHYATIEYRKTPTASPLSIDGSAVYGTSPASRRDFLTDSVGTQLQFQMFLTSSNNTPPVVSGIGLTFAVRPRTQLIYQFSVICEDGLVKRNGVPFRYGASTIRSTVQSMIDTPGSCTAVLPDETTCELSFTEYQEGLAWDDRTETWRSALQVSAVKLPVVPGFVGASGATGLS